MFYIAVYSGLSNKLIPLFSLLRIAQKEKKTIKCFWDRSAYQKDIVFDFNDLFEPIENIEFVNKNEYMKAFNDNKNKIYNRDGSDRDRNEVIYKGSGEQNTVFNYIVHAISYNQDNIVGMYIPTPRYKVYTNEFINELRSQLKKLKPIYKIQNKIEKIINSDKFKNNKVLGMHIRTTDGGFTDIDDNKSLEYIESFLNNNSDWNIYIASDNSKSEQKIINKFGKNKIIVFDDPFGTTYEDKFNRTTYGVINGVCDLFALSKCDKFIGTPGSSFTFMTWLLRNDDILEHWCKNPW